MPFKVGDVYYTELVLPGYGKLRRRSLGTTRKADALALENAIREVPRRGLLDPKLFQILDALQGAGRGKSGPIEPADILVAVKAPDGADAGLTRLVRRLDDPPLADIVEEYYAHAGERGLAVTKEDLVALPRILEYAAKTFAPPAGEKLRFSVLEDAGSVSRLLSVIRDGEKKLENSVVRFEKRSISKLLTFRCGRAARDV